MTALTDSGRAQVRRLEAGELDAAFALVWETFLTYEAPEYPPEGVEQFRRDVIASAEFRARCASGEQPMWGAFIGGELAGVMCLRAPCHISLAFVAARYQRRGVGKALMGALLEHVKRALPDARQVTVNSSPYGAPFYRALGFCDTDREQCVTGIRFIPMALSLDERASGT